MEPNFWIRKLKNNSNLDENELHSVAALPSVIKRFDASSSIVGEGHRSHHCFYLISGFCVRSKTTAEGKRQILSIHVPGDIPDLHSLHLPTMDHDVTSLGTCTIGVISHDAIKALSRQQPNVGEAFWRQTLIDSAIFREWLLNNGQRMARNRLLHFIIEFQYRLAAVGLEHDGIYDLPATQRDLADALSMTPVHISRVLKELREMNLLQVRKSKITIMAPDALASSISFNPAYLHQH